jgi:hypothetical protein
MKLVKVCFSLAHILSFSANTAGDFCQMYFLKPLKARKQIQAVAITLVLLNLEIHTVQILINTAPKHLTQTIKLTF